jgi:cyclophilin family peptidyl-prolyl cis-trans isomerase
MNKKYLPFVIAGVVVLAIVVWVVTSLSSKEEKTTMNDNQTKDTTAVVPQCTPKNVDAATIKKTVAPKGDIAVLTIAGFGDVKIKLDSTAAPQTVENFKKLIASGFYDCLHFHRIAPGFVIQGGDPKGDGTGGPGYTVPSEIKLKHTRGALAMARLPDAVNPKKESSGSQFYIALQDLAMLDGQYTVFGNVVAGMDVVDKIAKVELVPAGSPDGSPKTPVIIEKAIISE